MPINFDRAEFRKCLREQFDYVLKNESNKILQEALNEVVRQRLEDIAHEELNELGMDTEDDFGNSLEQLDGVQMHISAMDIDHRTLVRELLKKEMKKMIKGFIDENLS